MQAELSVTADDQVTRRNIVPKETVIKLKQLTLSPLIFVKKRSLNKSETIALRKLVVFENILSIVTQAYYKKQYEVELGFREIKLELEDCDLSEKSEAVEPQYKRNKTRRVRLSFVNETALKNSVWDNQDNEVYFGADNLLDHLVSPLKIDYPCGWLIRDLEYKRNSHL